MVYGGLGDREPIKVACDQCKKFVLINDSLDRYDDSVMITGWDDKPTAILRTFCSKACEDKYFNENQ